MLKAIIIDDEQDARDVLNMLIADFCPELSLAGMYDNGRDGVKAILKHNPDIVFMDIDMPGMSGFDVLDCVKTQKFKVVFVTAHNQHAIRAFKYCAIDYILKPPAPQDIIEAVEKARQLEFKTETSQYELLINNLKNEGQVPDVIALPMADGLQVVNVADILYCKADRNYTHVHLAGKKDILVSKQLKEFEHLLIPHSFFRVHHSALVNLRCIRKYVRGDGGYVIMKDDCSIEVSRQKKEEFIRLLNRV